jgi:hypothetical protein
MGGGGESKSEAYAKFGAGKYDSSDFERYVDSRGDLAAAWKNIVSNPEASDSKYWIDRGATSKSAFGRAHAAEDAKLYAGTYGAGGTKVVPGSAEYDDYFGGEGTYWDNYNKGEGSEGGGSDGTPESKLPWDNPTNKTNVYHPMLVPEYNDPQAQDWSEYMPDGQSGLLYQPWSQEYGEQFMQPNIWNYQPPELTVGRPQYLQNPLGIMDVTDYVPPSDDDDDEMTEEEKIASGNYDGNPGYSISGVEGWDSLSDENKATLTALGFNPHSYPGSADTSNAGPMGIGNPAGFGHNPGIDPDTGKTNAETAWDGQ